MPNIEIRGYGHGKSEELRNDICKVLNEMGLSDEAIISIVPLTSESCDVMRYDRPYLRIYSSDKKEIREIIVAFQRKAIHEDVEWLVLDGFLSKYQMRAGGLAN